MLKTVLEKTTDNKTTLLKPGINSMLKTPAYAAAAAKASLGPFTIERRQPGPHDADVFDKHAGRFGFILDTVSARHDYNSYLHLLRLDGTMVLVGLPDPAPVAGFSLITRRRRLAGSMIGGIRETREMLEFCARHGIASDAEVIPIQRINEAFERTVMFAIASSSTSRR